MKELMEEEPFLNSLLRYNLSVLDFKPLIKLAVGIFLALNTSLGDLLSNDFRGVLLMYAWTSGKRISTVSSLNCEASGFKYFHINLLEVSAVELQKGLYATESL